MKRIALALFGISLFMIGCDVIDDPVIPFTINYNEGLYGPAPTFGPPSSTTRNALVEDFTAHQCGNCPSAAIIAEDIANTYGDQVVVMAIHAGSLAEFNDEDPFSTDWTNPTSELYFAQLDFQANPLGRVNRYPTAGTILSPAEWEDKVNNMISQTAPVNLQMVVNSHPDNNHVNIHVNGQFLEDYAEDLKLVVLVLESHLIDYQLDYASDPEIIPDYEFNHVLRGSVNGPDGLDFASNGASGDEIQKDYTYVWNSEWSLDNSTIVAFVYDPDTGEVIQATQKYVTE